MAARSTSSSRFLTRQPSTNLTTTPVRVRMTRPPRETADFPDRPPPRVQRGRRGHAWRYENASTCFVDGWLIEPSARPERNIWVYGAGHRGRSVVEVLSGLPFAITWVDFEASRFPEEVSSSVRPLVTDPNSPHATGLAPDDADHLVMTHTHSIDLDICDRVLRRRFRSLGLIGSRTKRQRFAGRLSSPWPFGRDDFAPDLPDRDPRASANTRAPLPSASQPRT